MLATMTRGYVTVPRLETDLLGDEQEVTQTHRGAWLWLFDKAAWKRCVDRFGRFTVELQRGEIACSYRFLARAWNWSHGKVQRWLALLAERGKITMRTDQGIVVIALNGYAPVSESQKPSRGTGERPVDDRRVSRDSQVTKVKESKGDGDLMRFAPKRMCTPATASREGRKESRRTLVFQYVLDRFAGAKRTAAMNGLMGLDDRGEQAWFDELDARLQAEGWCA